MNKNQIQILKDNLGLDLSDDTIEKFNKYEELFAEYNSHTNLMSKGDLALLFEKHIFDSLGILKYKKFNPKVSQKILDIGCGGGFPSLILAICFENLKIIGVDSIGKKIKFIQYAAKELELKNIQAIKDRVENLPPQKVDIITCRAVGRMKEIWENSKYHLIKDGKFIFYKANPNVYNDELKELGRRPSEIIKYNLPTNEKHSRVLLIF